VRKKRAEETGSTDVQENKSYSSSIFWELQELPENTVYNTVRTRKL